ncbi:MAG: 2,3-bisphosphoglycerate-independent phosphoglycerate mutase, partial [Desulfosporosinus sp.]|nr:2,3-bisphosphoglycerate-independent phosphoglycerate mutase [Desulfosporosinus sp.]
EEIQKMNATLIVTADHGNAEEKVDPKTLFPITAHSCNCVPFILVDDKLKGHELRSDGALCDVAPTILKLLQIPVPKEMTGKSLLES